MNYAGFWKRFVAFMLDFLISGVLCAFFAVVVGVLYMRSAADSGKTPEQITLAVGNLANIVILIVDWLYHAGMESSSRQATFGKKAMGLYVTDTDGDAIGFGRATVRYIGHYISAVILLFGFIIAAFTPQKQALHDIIAGTLVLEE